MNYDDLTLFLAALSENGLSFHSRGGVPPGAPLRQKFNDLFYKPHAHQQLEMICLLQGNLALQINGHWRECPRRAVQIFVPGAVHGEHYRDPATGYRMLWATVLPAALLFHVTEHTPLTGYGTSKQRLAITPPMCPQLWKTSRAPDFARDLRLRAKFHYLLMECVEYTLSDQAPRGLRPADFHEQIVEQIKHYIREYYWEDISLARMAGIVHYSPGHLNAVFRRSEKMPLHRYINEVRLLQARQLLQNGRFLVKQAAAAVGFKDPLYFSRLFDRRFGIRPAAIRPARRGRDQMVHRKKTHAGVHTQRVGEAPALPGLSRQASLQVISTQKRSMGVTR